MLYMLRYSMEMHAVHINKETGKLAVVSKLFRAVQVNFIDLSCTYHDKYK